MYNRENFRRAEDILTERRLAAEATARRRGDEVREKSERIAEIDRELAKTGLSLFRAACAGEGIDDLRAGNLALQKERRALLRALGYPEDYTAVRYTCENCGDTGYVGVRMCTCLKQLLVEEAVRASGLGRLIGKQTFDNFDLQNYAEGEERDHMTNVLRMARRFADEMTVGGEGGNLLLTGKTGTGKTHLSSAIAGRMIERGYGVLYDSANNIIAAFEQDRFHAGYGKAADPQAEKYLECDLLILDDLGSEFSNSFTEACLYSLINSRSLAGLPTVVSTNLSPTEISSRYSDRFFSRIVGKGTVVLNFVGEDRRLS